MYPQKSCCQSSTRTSPFNQNSPVWLDGNRLRDWMVCKSLYCSNGILESLGAKSIPHSLKNKQYVFVYNVGGSTGQEKKWSISIKLDIIREIFIV